ncbi:FtsQ-type POTRA domain-containing protein [Arthrobacter sp. PAMC25564]|uniref:cell division protein FtsQ/DivIB n=1 Tax=Arthrobacter sp. PAMC25564 TaxID=2565366 RepID=UPI0010A24FC9|nr:FtsQ-type POTRA domain-containing protein [Arthrobacter sp. PAMC25564]QCB98157.1 FtsQ-type POTRA domain-containing protein [Arthrobacter sp. PAMC25564]
MPSTRRPTYKARTRAPAAPSSEVISASKSSSAGQAPGQNAGQNPAKAAGRNPAKGTVQTARAGSGGTAGEPKPGTSPAGAQDNVLSFPEPKAKRRKRIFLTTVGILVVLMAGIVATAVYSPLLALRTVTVEGTKLLSAEQVQAALAPLQGKPLPQIGEEDVAALLQPLVQVKAVSTQAHPPATLQVHITERVPVALVRQGTTFQLVDVDGIQLSTTTDPDSIPLPVIDGGGGTLPKDLFQAITGVLGALPADVLAKLSDASAKSVDAVELRLVDGQTIVWGNAGEKELKARVLAALLKAPADPKNPVRIYDVSVPRHPVTR